MADEFDNRLDAANLERLNNTLRGVEDVLERNLAAGERAAEESTTTRRRVEQQAVREGKGVTSRANLVPEGTKSVPDEVRAQEDAARAAARRAEAEGRVNDALARRPRTQADEVRRASAAESNAAAQQLLAARQGRADRLTVDEAIARSQQSEAQLRAQRFTEQTFARGPLQLGPGRQPGATPIAGGAGGGGPIIPPPPAPPGGPPEGPRGPRGDFTSHLGGVREEAQLAGRAEAADLRWRTEMERLSRTIGINGDDLRRHGALTTEFISAAARGQVEIRELGYQVGATIGKFAGWTAAASLVFGVARAMGQLRDGAMGSLDAVNQVQRIIPNVDTDQLNGDIRARASRFNVPVADVGEAVYGSAKVFGDYQQSLTGAESALFAMKVGELSAADATRYLNSIVKGFRLDADQLPDVFDAINQAQNKFGGNVGDIVAGVARAGNAFRNVGGDYKSLIALIQTGSLTTGRTGLEIATGLQRSAEQIIRSPQRRATIVDLLGVDPADTSIVEVYRRAMQAVQTATPVEAANIARALSTPELATSRILPILQNRARFEEILGELTSPRTHGSAQRELDRVLQSATERLHAFGVEMQNVGSALAQANAFDFFGVMLVSATKLVHETSLFVGLIDGIMGPLGPVVAGFLEISAAVALMRRFNVGGLFPEGGAGRQLFGRSPARLERAEVQQGLGFQRDFLRDEQQQTARRAALQLRNVEAERARDVRLQGMPDVSDEELEASTRRVQGSIDRYHDLWNEHATTAGELERTQRQINGFQRDTQGAAGRSLQGVREAALRNEIHYTGNIGPLPVPGEAQRMPLPNGLTPGDPLGARSSQVVPGDPLGRSIEQQEREMRTFNREQSRLQSRLSRLGAAGGAVNLGARGASSAIGAAGRALSGVGAAAMSIASALGPLDAVIAGVVVAMAAVASAREQSRQATEIFANPGSVDALRAAAQKELGDRSNLDRAQSLFSGVWNQTSGRLLNGLGGQGFGPGNTQSADDVADDAARAAQREADNLARQRRGGRLLLQSQIQGRLRSRLNDARTDAQRQRAIDQAQNELDASYGSVYGTPTRRDKAAKQTTADQIRRAQADVSANTGSIRDALAGIAGIDDALDFGLRTTNQIARQGFTGVNRSRIRGEINTLRSKYRESDDPQERQKILAEIDRAQQQYLGQAEQSLDGIEYLSPRRQSRLRQRYIDRARQVLGGRNATPGDRHALENIVREQERAQYETDTGAFDARTARLQAQTADPAARARQLAARMGQRVQMVRDAMRRGIAGQNELENALAQQAQAQQQVVQEGLSRFQARQQLASAQFGATLPTQAATLARAVQDASDYVGRVRAAGSRVDPNVLTNAQRDLATAQQAQAEYVRQQAQDMISARAEDAISRTEDPVKQAQARLREAEQLQRFAQDPAARVRAGADVRNRRREARQAQQQDAFDTIDFEASIGKIDRDTQITRLQALLAHVHGNRDLRRQIQQQVYQLKQEAAGSQGDMDLNLGNIRIPSMYEVARVVRGGAAGVTQVNRNTVNVHVNGPQDYDALGRVLEQHVAGGGKAVARAAGER